MNGVLAEVTVIMTGKKLENFLINTNTQIRLYSYRYLIMKRKNACVAYNYLC